MPESADRLTVWEHVGVLRRYALVGGLWFVAATILLFTYAGDALTEFLLHPAPSELVFLSPMGPFLFKMKTAVIGGGALSLPLWLFLAVRFVGDALGRRQRVALYSLALAACALAVAAAVLAYLYIVPLTLGVLAGFSVPGTSLMLTAEAYLSFVLLQVLVTCVALELPVVIIGLAYLGLLDPDALRSRMRTFFLGLLVGLAVLTPTTDVFTLLLVTIPTFVLCIGALVLARVVYNRSI